MAEKQNVISEETILENEMSLKEFISKIQEWWLYLLSKWKIILLAGLFGGVLGLIYAFSKRPVFIAEITFALEDDKVSGGLSGALGLASQFGIDLGSSGGGAFAGDNLIELMKSRSMIEKTLLSTIVINGNSQTLANYYMEKQKKSSDFWGKNDIKGIQFLPGVKRSDFTRQQDSLLGVFYKSLVNGGLKVEKVDKKLSILKVQMSSSNELFSKFFSERLVKEVSDFYIETKTKKSSNNVAILQYQTDSVRRALNYAISGVAYSVDANPNANAARRVLNVPSQRRQVDVQANQAILTELVKNLEISRVTLRKETPLIQVIDRPILPLVIDKPSKKTSLLIGGFFSGFLAILYLILRRILVNL